MDTNLKDVDHQEDADDLEFQIFWLEGEYDLFIKNDLDENAAETLRELSSMRERLDNINS